MENKYSGEPLPSKPAATQKYHHSHYTSPQAESLRRLYSTERKTLIEHAEQLVADMKCRLPDGGLMPGQLHQLEGKDLHGIPCAFMLVIEDHNAIYGCLSTGVIVEVDQNGRRNTCMIGGRR